jgi:hypothetical protein
MLIYVCLDCNFQTKDIEGATAHRNKQNHTIEYHDMVNDKYGQYAKEIRIILRKDYSKPTN